MSITDSLVSTTATTTTATIDSITAANEADQAETNSDISEQFDTFLTLLTAQIRNQDPLAPLDSTQFVEQLATFSNLELQAEGNATLDDIARILAENFYGTENTEDT